MNRICAAFTQFSDVIFSRTTLVCFAVAIKYEKLIFMQDLKLRGVKAEVHKSGRSMCCGTRGCLCGTLTDESSESPGLANVG